MASCKYCGSESVMWKRLGGKWVMHDTSGEFHLCLKNKDIDGNPRQNFQEPSSSEAQEALDELTKKRRKSKETPKNVSEMLAELAQEEIPDVEGDKSEDGEIPMLAPVTSLPKPILKSMAKGHKQTMELFALLAAGQKVFVSGPAGSGKTTAFKLITPALGAYFERTDYDFYFKSVCDLTGKHEFEGFINAAGQIVDTDFRKAYIEGHLYLIDEVDAANANVLTVLNATIENGWGSFPDGKHKQHSHFRIGVAANTVGLGADALYVGRTQLDAAFRNRFYFLAWEYDEELEMRLAGKDQADWVQRVQKLRRAHLSLGKLAPRLVISPRASINGAMLLRNNIVTDWNRLENALVWQGCSEDDKKRVLKAVE